MQLVHFLVAFIVLRTAAATKPPGYVEKPKIHDPHPPNYKYSYTVSDDKSGSQQGHLENRKGEHTQGHYYVNDPKEASSQDVQYLVDDWGFHPLVQYSSRTATGHSSARFALGEAAVKGLQGQQLGPQGPPVSQGLPVSQKLAPAVPLLAGTVLPAGTSTDGFIHHDNTNGVQTHHTMALHPNSPGGPTPPQPTLFLTAQQNLFLTPQQNPEQIVTYQPIQQILQSPNQPQIIPQVSTVLSPTLPENYQQEQNIHLSPNGGVKYSSNVGGDNSKSFVQVELGNQNTNLNPGHVVNYQLNAGVPVYNPVNFGQIIQEDQKGILVNQPSFVNIQQGVGQDGVLNNGQVVSNANFVQEISEDDDNEAERDYLLTTQVNGQYGEKLLSSSYQNNKGNVQLGRSKAKFVPKQNVYISSTTQIPIFSSTAATGLKQNSNVYTKLVESTQNLVSNEDLLSINGAAEQDEQNQNTHSADTYSFNEHQQVVNIRPTESIVALGGTLSVGDIHSKPPTDAGIVSIEREQNFQYAQEKGSPIIVPDLDYDYNNNEVTSTQSSINSRLLQNFQQDVQVNNIFSTTQSTVETDVTGVDYVSQQSYTKPLDSTIVVTPRPVSQKFLAPLTAGLSLVSSNNVEKYLDCAHTEKTTDVKFVEDEVIEQENEDNKAINRELKKQLTQIYNDQTKSTDNNQIQYPSALEESKKIQVNSNQQFYQLGAQQVLIHPAEQQNQLVAEEISQQIEEIQGESIKQESQQQYQNQQQQLQQNYQIQQNQQHNYQIGQNQQQQLQQNYQIQQNQQQNYQIEQNQQQNFQNQQIQEQQIQNYQKQQNVQQQQYQNQLDLHQHQAEVQNYQLTQNQQHVVHQTVQNADSNYNSDYNQVSINGVSHRQVADQQVIGCNDDYSQVSATSPPVALQYTQSNGHLFDGGQSTQQSQHQQPYQPQYYYVSQQQDSQHQQNHGTVGVSPAHLQYQPYLLYGTPQRITLQQMRQNLGVSYPQDQSEKQIVEVKVPYPVEKIVEKVIDRPVEVTRYVDKPYPIEKRVLYPVQVEKIVEKQVPYPVEVKVPYKVEVPYPVEKIIEKQVRYPVHINVPYPVEKIVEKIVERPVEVTKYVEKPYPVEKRVPYPVHVDRVVEKQVPYPVEVKVPYKVEVERPVPYTVEKIVNRPYAVLYPVNSHAPQNQNQAHGQIQTQWNHGWQSAYNHHQQNQALYRNINHISVEQSKYSRPAQSDSGYSYNKPSVSFNTPSHDSFKQGSQQHSSISQYLGPVPLKSSTDTWNYGGLHHNENSPKFRRAERTLQGYRLEYGFKPPLIPSLEIDLNGHPVKREA